MRLALGLMAVRSGEPEGMAAFGIRGLQLWMTYIGASGVFWP
jgi:hypothetical protein